MSKTCKLVLFIRKKKILDYTYKIMDDINMSEKVSIIVPVYNQEQYLIECVKSICNQTYSNIEIILIDDGSRKRTSDICDELQKVDIRISVIHQKNCGLSQSRINGLKKSTGKWVMFVDNDDLISNYIVEDFSEFFNRTDVDIIAGKRYDSQYPDLFLQTSRSKGMFEEDGKILADKIYEDKQKRIITPLWGKVYRKSFLEGVDFYKYFEMCPTIFFEDILVTPILYYYARKIVILDGVYYVHRECNSSLSRTTQMSPFFYEQIESGKILLNFFTNHNMRSSYRFQLSAYLHTILRIWCLIEYDTLIDSDDTENIKRKIIVRYRQYIWEYFRYAEDKSIRKVWVLFYAVNPKFWGKITRRLYYKEHR